MCRSTPTALTHLQLSSQPHTGACTRASSWYPSSWCLCLFLLSSPFPLRYLRPWVLSCCFPAAALLSFNLCQQGRVPVWWCLISLGAPGAVSGARGLSQQMAVCRGDLLGLLVSHFPAGFCFPQLPMGWFPRICLCRSLLHVSSIGLSTWSPLRQCTGARAVVWGTGAACWGGLGRQCLLGAGVFVCVSPPSHLFPCSLCCCFV